MKNELTGVSFAQCCSKANLLDFLFIFVSDFLSSDWSLHINRQGNLVSKLPVLMLLNKA